MKKNWKAVLYGIEIIICCILAAVVIGKNSDQNPLDIKLSDWKSFYIQYEDGWYVDETILSTNDDVELLNGPDVDLERGSYAVTVDYSTEFEQECELSVTGEQSAYIKSGINKLVRNLNQITFRFTLTEDVDSLEMLVRYDGQGFLRINQIEIRPDAAGVSRFFVCVVILFLLLDLFIIFQKNMEQNRNTVSVVAGMIFLISLPLFIRGITDGHDLSVHFMRIEGIAREIQNGHFPVRISSLWLDGHGYPISIYYGDLLLYIPAVLRLIGFPVVAAYKIYVVLIHTGTVIISYICFKKLFNNTGTACMVTLAYVTAGYRFVDVYVRAAVGEYSAMMFLPLIALAFYRIYTQAYTGWKQTGKNALLLASGMTGLIGTHILSTQMIVFVLALICILLWKRTFQKHTLCTFILAVCETLALNLYFIIPFIDYYLNVSVNINGTVNGDLQRIQSSGAYIGQYFAFFQDSFGLDGDNIYGRLGLTPGLALMMTLIFAFALWINKKASKEIKYLTVLSVLMLFIASDLFPWNHMAENYHFLSIFSQVQFPWRYISLAVIFLSMLLGFIFQYYTEAEDKAVLEKLYVFTTALCMISSFYFVSDYCNNANTVFYYDTPELNTYAVGGAEYLREDTDWVLYPSEIEQENMTEARIESRKGYQMELYCETGDEEGTVEVPLFHYKGYRVTDESGNTYKITDGKYNFIKFSVPAGFSGQISVDFVEPWYWRMGEAVSLLVFLGLCAGGLYQYSGRSGNRLGKVFNKKGDKAK